MLLKMLCISLSVAILTACQLNPRLVEPSGEVYGDKARLFIHHNQVDLNKYDIYLDQQKVSAKMLNDEGVQLPYGSHAIDIIDRKTSKKLRHVDFQLNNEKHFQLCPSKSNSDLILEEQGVSQQCIPNKLK